MKQKAPPREFNLHEAYQGYDGRWYTIERRPYHGYAVVAWRFENGLFEREYTDPYQLFAKYDYAEHDLRGKGCKGNG